MNIEIPESYKTGIRHIEELDLDAMTEWLRAELYGQVHVLAGQAYDYPVQAIINHHPYLSPEAQKRMANAIEVLILDWKREMNTWDESAVNALLSLAAELPVISAKSKLQSLIETQAFSSLAKPLRLAALGTIATLSSNNDRTFWKKLPVDYPKFAGMAFQVLARIAPDDALQLLGRLPPDEYVVGSVARKLPDFVSHFEPKIQASKLKQISEALALLPAESAEPLKLSLNEAGFDLVEFPLAALENQDAVFKPILIQITIAEVSLKKKFEDSWRGVRTTIKPKNSLEQVYARTR